MSYILSAKRTPIGAFMGQLSPLAAPVLGATAIKSAIESAKIDSSDVDQVIMGQVLTAGTGQAPARQASLKADIPTSAPCMTINKVCGSGLKSVMLAHDAIQLGQSQVVVAGGQECMSQTPHLLPKSRQGFKMGHTQLIDSMLIDGLWDPYNDWHMGNAGELCAKEHGFTREDQDQFAKESYEMALAAYKENHFAAELCNVEVPQRKATLTVEADEEPKKVMFDKMPKLRPAFQKEGTITAANASKLNDGASALVMASEEFVKSKNLKPLAKVIAHSTFAQDPKWFTTAPVGAMKSLSEKTGIDLKDIDLYEINEAFSVVTLAAMKELNIERSKVNVHGGAVALGHPIGASGARILTTLVHALHTHSKKYGMASICLGGGEGVAVLIERV